MAISRYAPRVVRFFTATALVFALGMASATAAARPKHRAAAPHHHYAKTKAKKGQKVKDKGDATDAKDKADSEHDVTEPGKARGPAKKGSKGTGVPKVVETEKQGQGKKAIKTYKFGPQAVEGRLKSPQIIYFLRRVRAEFAAGDLGHRSFMRELSDTRRDPAFR
jgi:hypothetical protein